MGDLKAPDVADSSKRRPVTTSPGPDTGLPPKPRRDASDCCKRQLKPSQELMTFEDFSAYVRSIDVSRRLSICTTLFGARGKIHQFSLRRWASARSICSTFRVFSAPILDLRASVSVSSSTIYSSHTRALFITVNSSVYIHGPVLLSHRDLEKLGESSNVQPILNQILPPCISE
jgi:hypothetical protein